MKLKVIKVKDYLLLIDEEAEIKEENYVYSVLYGIGQIIRDIGGESTKNYRPLIAKFQESEVHQEYGRDGIWQMDVVGEKVAKNNCNKVIAYYPLTEETKELDLPLLPLFEENMLSLLNKDIPSCFSGVKGHEIEDYNKGHRESWIKGYKAAQPKQFSLEDMKNHIQEFLNFCSQNYSYDSTFGWYENGNPGHRPNTSTLIENYIQSLSTQQLHKEFIPEYSRVRLPKGDDGWEDVYDLKTTTNSEGKEELVGTWKF